MQAQITTEPEPDGKAVRLTVDFETNLLPFEARRYVLEPRPAWLARRQVIVEGQEPCGVQAALCESLQLVVCQVRRHEQHAEEDVEVEPRITAVDPIPVTKRVCGDGARAAPARSCAG